MPLEPSDLSAAYHEILGIPPAEQPPHHYRLLGIQAFETNREVISNAAARQINYVRQHAMGVYAEVVQHILNEVAAAKLCLLKEAKKEAYDARLKATLFGAPNPARVVFRGPQSPPAASPVLPPSSVSAAPLPPAKQQPPPVPAAAPLPPATPNVRPTNAPVAPRAPAALASDIPPLSPAAAPKPIDNALQAPLPNSAQRARPASTVLEMASIPAQPATNVNAEGSQEILQKWTFGRDAACDVVIAREVVSQQHCRLEQTAEGFFLIDLESTNGTYLNGQRISARTKVSPHDKITLGRHTPLPWPRSNKQGG